MTIGDMSKAHPAHVRIAKANQVRDEAAGDSGVNPALTPNRRAARHHPSCPARDGSGRCIGCGRSGREPVETPEYAAFCRRIIRAYARRVADADDVDLAEMVAVRDAMDAAIIAAVHGMRDQQGASWAEIGRALGVTRQAAQARFGRSS